MLAILKPGKSESNTQSYRPISLLQTGLKFPNKLVCNKINEHIEQNKILPEQSLVLEKIEAHKNLRIR